MHRLEFENITVCNSLGNLTSLTHNRLLPDGLSSPLEPGPGAAPSVVEVVS